MKRAEKIDKKDRLLYGGIAALLAILIIYVFYQNEIAAAVGGGIAFFVYPELCRRSLREKRKRQLIREFREVLGSLVTALRAGRSLEMGLQAAWEDMDPTITPLLYKEWRWMLNRLQVNTTAENCLKELAQNSDVEEIQSLAEIIEIGKKSQGDVIKIIENTVGILQDKIEMQEEVQVLLAKKRMEQRIINVMPFLVLGMLLLISPDYLAPLYTTLQGRVIMSICVLITIGSFWLSRRIAEIDI